MTEHEAGAVAGYCGRASCRARSFWALCRDCGRTWLQECGTCGSFYTETGMLLSYPNSDCGCRG